MGHEAASGAQAKERPATGTTDATPSLIFVDSRTMNPIP